jgi:hypothetical protein
VDRPPCGCAVSEQLRLIVARASAVCSELLSLVCLDRAQLLAPRRPSLKLAAQCMSASPSANVCCREHESSPWGHPLATSVNWGNSQPRGLLGSAAVSVQSVTDLVAHIWFSITGCAIAHQSPIRIKAGRSELAARYTCPWPGTPAPENPQFLAVSISIDRITRSHNIVASLRAIQPLMARGAGATSLQTGGMAVARNQHDGFANPKAALPPPSHDRQLLFMQRPACRRTGRLRA